LKEQRSCQPQNGKITALGASQQSDFRGPWQGMFEIEPETARGKAKYANRRTSYCINTAKRLSRLQQLIIILGEFRSYLSRQPTQAKQHE